METKRERSWTEINLDNFSYNINNLKDFFQGKAYLQIVKADAYGHGSYQIAQKAVEHGAIFLGVANYQEAILLRFQDINLPILILSPSLDNEIIPIVQYDLIPSVQDVEFAKKLNTVASLHNKKIKIHINIDTGMGRSGFYYPEAIEGITKIKELKNLEIDGIFSHFAASENDKNYSQWQFERFKKLIKSLDFTPKYVHISNSSGLINIKEDFTNLVRVGLLSYGVYTDNSLKDKIKLKPVMSFYSKIGHIKTAQKGDSIGYNRTFVAKGNILYAILPIGYADGYDFMLSNKGVVRYKNKICNVIGKVSMDMVAIDISQIDNPQIGDTVQLLGEKEISAEKISSLYNGSAYELLCQIGRRAKRYYVEKGEISDSSPLMRRNFVPSDYSPQKLNHIIEKAIGHRLQSTEISAIIYDDFLDRFFKEKDKNIHYRENFEHILEFSENDILPDYYLVKTTLTYEKILRDTFFYVNCANNEKQLEEFFLEPQVEYRWLLDYQSKLDEKHFKVTKIKINDIELNHRLETEKKYIKIKCYNDILKNLVGKKVKFKISTITYYPKKSHQLSVYINELTKNINIKFIYNDLFESVDCVPFFAGKKHFPKIIVSQGVVTLTMPRGDWIFPNSGVVFTY